jgi:hypothetical protein
MILAQRPQRFTTANSQLLFFSDFSHSRPLSPFAGVARILGLEAVEEFRALLWRGAGNDSPKSILILDDVSLARIAMRQVDDASRVEGAQGALGFGFVGVDFL